MTDDHPMTVTIDPDRLTLTSDCGTVVMEPECVIFTSSDGNTLVIDADGMCINGRRILT